MKRVLFVNRSYWPDCEATGQLLTELCEDLAEHPDLDVSVICGQPNNNPDDETFLKSGIQIRNGVQINRVRHTRFDKSWRRRWRAFNMITFLTSATITAFFRKRPDIVVVETDPPLLCVLGFLLQKIRGCKLLLYLQDIYPDVAVALKQLPPWFPTRLVRRVFYGIYKRADQVIVLSTDMRRALIDSGVDEKKISIVPNWVDTKQLQPVPKSENKFREQHEINGKFVVMYSGNIGLSQRLDTVIDAAGYLKDRSDILFLLVGDGASRGELEQNVAERGLTNVRFIDYQPKRNLSQSLSAADVHLVLLAPEVTKWLMPSKIYSILAAGTMTVALADPKSELAMLVDEEQVGVVCPFDDADQLARIVSEIAESREVLLLAGQRARRLAVEHFDRQITVRQFWELLAVDAAQSMPSSTTASFSTSSPV